MIATRRRKKIIKKFFLFFLGSAFCKGMASELKLLAENPLGAEKKFYIVAESVKKSEHPGYFYADIFVKMPQAQDWIERFDGSGNSVFEPANKYRSHMQKNIYNCNEKSVATYKILYFSGL